ncbi:MAG TPA: NlpC/P60 family protein [Chthoniobacterales bacterium]|jgi:cell wall-associated NlpC family hydrolase
MRRVNKVAGALFLIAILAAGPEQARAEESLGNKIKKLFAPTPTPAPRKHRKSSTAPKKKEEAEKTPTPKPSATPENSPSSSSSKKKKAAASPTPAEKAEPEASASPKKQRKSSPTPSPDSSPSPSPKKKKSSPTPESDSSPSASPRKKRKHLPSPTATPAESPAPSSTPTESPEAGETPSATASPSPSAKKKGAPATIAAKDISGFENYPPNVRKIAETALELTTRNLDYKYGSADPSTGGMDCSGFVFYVLTQNGVRDVPRDSSQQYVWLRKAGNFKAVNSRQEDTFELDDLVPGDLLFWTGTYNIERDPPITHAMIYLGREKGTNQRIMVGASDGRTYKGESRYGVSVFDFKIPHPGKTGEGRTTPSFIGYGHIPGVR